MIYAMILTHNDWERPIGRVVASIMPFVDKVVIFDSSKERPQALLDVEIVYGQYEGWNDGETAKWKGATNYGGEGSWAFYLASDELLHAGGPNIRKAAQWFPDANIFQVVMMEQNKMCGFRENMFKHGAFMNPDRKVATLPIVIDHLRLPSHWRNEC